MKKILKRVFIALIFVVIIAVFSAIGYCVSVANSVELDESVMTYKRLNLKIYDKNGDEIELCGFKENLSYEEIPINLINAFVCIDDKKYFSHNGIDVERIAKALVKNLISGSNKEGASTITQQFIKNTHLTIDKTLDRKVKEIKLALELEKKYTKEEIITAYFNILYFGNSIYGVQSASRTFFGKDCKDLTLSECATLAGIVKNPAGYSPLKNIENSKSRRNLVLSKMQENGYISMEEYLNAKNQEIVLQKSSNKIGLSYLNCLLEECSSLLKITEKELAYSDYKIYTEYDVQLQNYIEKTLQNENNLAKRISKEKSDSYALVTDNESGLINAYYNSLNVNINEFRRQPGSTIKPFVSYMPAISKGMIHPATPILDEPKSFGGYSPSNYGNKYFGWTTVRQAVSKSINSVAVELMNDYGVLESIEYAKKYGLTFDKNDYNLATALGGMTYGVSPIEITGAYMTLARSGNNVEPSFVKRIEDKNLKVIYQKDSEGKKVESDENVYLMTSMLEDCAKSGTASRMNIKNYNVASKTGTVGLKNGCNNDIWNLSYTSKNTVCVWMGNTKSEKNDVLTKDSLASVYPTEIAKRIFEFLYKEATPPNFKVPDNIVNMPYSKEHFENDHVLMSPSEYALPGEVYYDLFNKSVLLPSIDYAVGFEDPLRLDVEISNNGVCMEFDAMKNVKYSIQRASLFEDWNEIYNVNGNGDTQRFVDKEITYGSDYIYKIEAYVINYKNEIKFLGQSEEKYIAMPFELW